MKKIVMVSSLLMTILFAELQLGKALPSWQLVSQQGSEVVIPNKGKIRLLISSEKGLSEKIHTYLKKQDRDFLKERKTIYVSDISSLPNFLVELFVLPTLKGFNFTVALLKEENSIEYSDGKVTVVSLNDGEVMEVMFVEVDDLW
jgi:hypothetical protein